MNGFVLAGSTATGALGVLVLSGRLPVVVVSRRDAVGRSEQPTVVRVFVGLLVTAGVAAVSGWVLPSMVLGAGAAWGAGLWLGRRRVDAGELVRLEALATWIEHLRDVLLAGDQPIGAISSTVRSCPAAIRPMVRRLAAELADGDAAVALRRFADRIDDPVGDLVAAGLAIAIRRGARTTAVLTALANHARMQCDRRRVVEAERAPVRREVQVVTAIMGILVLGLFVVGRHEHLAAYATPTGQLVLATALLAYLALLVRVHRLARFSRPARFLSGGAS